MKYIAFAISIIVIPFEIANIVINLLTISSFLEVGWGWTAYAKFYAFDVVKCVAVIFLCIFIIVSILRKSNIINSTRYTYEEFKKHIEERKANRKQAKKEKLKNKLEEMEKDTE